MNRLQQLKAFVEKCREAEDFFNHRMLAHAEAKLRDAISALDQPAVVGEDCKSKVHIVPDAYNCINWKGRLFSFPLPPKIAIPSTEAVEQIDERVTTGEFILMPTKIDKSIISATSKWLHKDVAKEIYEAIIESRRK